MLAMIGLCGFTRSLSVDIARGFSYLRRGGGEVPTEGTIEVGQVFEASIEGHGADGPIGQARIDEHAIRAREALTEHERRKRGVLGLEQHLNVTRRNALACRNKGERQIGTVKVLDNVRLYCMQLRRADASTLCVRFRVSCRSDCQCDEVVHVYRHDVPEFRSR